jgi:hypothetical protein
VTVLVLASKVVDVGQLLRVVEAALIAVVGVSIAFSLVIRGATRADERRHESRPLAAGAHALLAAMGLAACVAAIAFGISVMLAK